MKKQKKTTPKVQILGDLEDVKKLVDLVNKKKSIVLFRNSDDGICYADIERIMVEYTTTDIKRLEKDFRIIYFDFLPEKKTIKPVAEEKPLAGKSIIVKKRPAKAQIKAPAVKKPDSELSPSPKPGRSKKTKIV